MRATLLALAAASAVLVAAGPVHDRHVALHGKRNPHPDSTPDDCGCTTVYSTWYGEATLVQPAPSLSTTTLPLSSVSTAVSTSVSTSNPATSALTISKSISTPSLASSASTAPKPTSTLEHATSTSMVPKSTSTPEPVASTSTVSKPIPVTTSTPGPSTTPRPTFTSTPLPPPTSTSTPASAPAPVPVPSSAPASAAPSAAPAQNGLSSGSDSGSGSSGGLWAMTYTPYKSGPSGKSRCATAAEVLADVATIKSKGFGTVRTYGTDCSGLVNIGNACKASGMKMIVGIYIDSSGVNGASVGSQVNDVRAFFSGAGWGMVEMVLVGNEALFNRWASGPQLAGLIGSVRGTLRAAGYGGPVSTADTMAGLQGAEGELCGAVDVLAANIHPFFDGATSALTAGSFVAGQQAMLSRLCGGAKAAHISESGWPSSGRGHGAAVPSAAEQAVAIESIRRATGGRAVFFSFEDDHWKGAGEYGVESSWGCLHLF